MPVILALERHKLEHQELYREVQACQRDIVRLCLRGGGGELENALYSKAILFPQDTLVLRDLNLEQGVVAPFKCHCIYIYIYYKSFTWEAER